MTTEQSRAISPNPGRAAPPEVPTPSDGQLLGRFVERRDEAAFAELVSRHGPMVWGVCRRLLGNHQDAEDAFQATFLVLVRKASSVVPRELVGNWLYGVAYQTALKARAVAGRRRTRERQVAEMPEPQASEPELWNDLQPILDRELNGLPAKYRVPVVLCDLEGKTHKEAARQLGCPTGTLSARVKRARALLAKRFARYGLAVSAGSLAAVLAQQAAPAAVPSAVAFSTIKAATLFAAGQGTAAGAARAPAVALTEGVLKAMLLAKLRGVMLLLLAALLAVGVALATYGLVQAAWPRSGNAAGTGPSEFTDLQAKGEANPEADKRAEGTKPPPKAEPEPPLPKVTTRGGPFGPESFDQALEWMRGDNQAAQLIAIGSLARLEMPYEPRREEVTAQLEKMLNGRDRLVASRCAEALYVWATAKQVPSLIKSLEDKFCRKAAMQTLGRLKDERAVEPLARFLQSDKHFDREPAAAALIAIGPAAEKEVRKYLTDDNAATRDEVARILKQLGKSDRDDDFNRALAGLKDANALSRKKALAWFGTADPAHPRRAEAAEALAAMVKDGDVFARQAAIGPLCRWGSRREVPVLLAALKETMLGIPNKTLVLATLGKWGDERALPVLGEFLAGALISDGDAAADALVQFGPAGEAEALKHLGSNQLAVKGRVCRVLKEVGTRASLKPLQDEVDRAGREKYPGHETVAANCQAALKQIQEREK
jgi:RNA polymerase sigma factor (sigma-70 family)